MYTFWVAQVSYRNRFSHCQPRTRQPRATFLPSFLTQWDSSVSNRTLPCNRLLHNSPCYSIAYSPTFLLLRTWQSAVALEMREERYLLAVWSVGGNVGTCSEGFHQPKILFHTLFVRSLSDEVMFRNMTGNPHSKKNKDYIHNNFLESQFLKLNWILRNNRIKTVFDHY